MKKMKSILIVDDDQVCNMITEMRLKRMEVSRLIKVVFNGKEAVEYLKNSPTDAFPDLILLDLNMPLMDGYEFLNYWGENGLSGKSKICLYTNSSMMVDEQKIIYDTDIIGEIEKPLTQKGAEKILQYQYVTTFGG